MLRLIKKSAAYLKKRFTPQGRFLLIVLTLSAIIGLDTYRTLIYQIFSLAAAIVILSLISLTFVQVRVTARRVVPRYGSAEEEMTYRIIVEQNSQEMIEGLTIFESVIGLQDAANSPESDASRKKIGGNKKRQKKLQSNEITLFEKSVPPIAPRGFSEVTLKVRPSARGKLILDKIHLGVADVFNISRKLTQVGDSQSILILPKRYLLPDFQLPGARRHQPGGVSFAFSVGDSEEFSGMREYRPGDPLRRIHWRSWAKVGKPVVKEFEEEFFVRHALILDTFSSGPVDEIFEEAVSLAASFACTVQTQESLLDLLFVGTEAFCFTSGRGLNSTEKMLEILAGVQLCRDKPFSFLAALVSDRIASVSGCMCIFLQMSDEHKKLLTFLHGKRVPVVVFVIIAEGAEHDEFPEFVGSSISIHCIEAGKIQEGLEAL